MPIHFGHLTESRKRLGPSRKRLAGADVKMAVLLIEKTRLTSTHVKRAVGCYSFNTPRQLGVEDNSFLP